MTKKIVFESEEKIRIDKYVFESGGLLSRSAAAKMLAEGKVLLNGKTVKPSTLLNIGDVIEIFPIENKELSVEAEKIPLDIVYEDNDIIVINKPKGMVVHPACGHFEGTLVNALLAHCKDSLSGINGVIRPGIVHRIDKDTSGLIIAAKNDKAHLSLAEQIKDHSAYREYIAMTVGSVLSDGTIDAPIGRNPKDRKKMAVTDKNSKNAVTHYKVIENFKGFSLIECKLETGRTHQIRVHMAHIKKPLLGDEVYGGKVKGFKTEGQMLHAIKLTVTHPSTGERMTFETPYPEYFNKIINLLRKG